MFKIKQRKTGKYFFILEASNGYVLVTSQNYSSKAACYNGIESVKTHATTKIIEDDTK